MRKLNCQDAIPMELISKTILSPFEFVHLSEKDRSNIKSTRIIPPQLGKKRRSFGKIEITYETPVYAMQK